MFWQINVQTYNNLSFVKAVDFDYSYTSSGAGNASIYDFNNFLTNELGPVLRMSDYYHAYTIFPKKTFFVKNFMLFVDTSRVKEKPYN